MTNRRSYSYRLPKITILQIAALAEFAGCSDANIITLAVDRMMRDFATPPTLQPLTLEAKPENTIHQDYPRLPGVE